MCVPNAGRSVSADTVVFGHRLDHDHWSHGSALTSRSGTCPNRYGPDPNRFLKVTTMIDWEQILAVEPVAERVKVAEMCCDTEVFRQGRTLILRPGRDLRVLPSGFFNRDFVDSPTEITNNSSIGTRPEMALMGKSLDTNDQKTAGMLRKVGLDPGTCVAFGTAAQMENAVVRSVISEAGVRVSVATTGGVRGNGGRAGDPASYDEATRVLERPGTIVIMVLVEAGMTDGALFDAMLTATQAKSCVLQELMARSLYSHGVATGSGTDQVSIGCLRDAELPLTSTTVTTDVGDAIAKCVKEALYEALDLQSGMTHDAQRDVYVMLSRFGLRESDIRSELHYQSTMDAVIRTDDALRRDPEVCTAVSAALHLQDEVDTGSIPPAIGLSVAKSLIEGSILPRGDIDPILRLVLDDAEDVPHYLGIVVSALLRKRAQEVTA